ncbi:hypothetical protein AB0283_32195 [Micromonospora vinacea]|uniref:hypothetical protein n=1 Tax=Micromonospora vinacea TaxID=709878 RepID=UPI00344FCF9A
MTVSQVSVLGEYASTRVGVHAVDRHSRRAALGMSTHAARTAVLFQLAIGLPAGLLARCLGIDINSAVDWQRAAAKDWHAYAARITAPSYSERPRN